MKPVIEKNARIAYNVDLEQFDSHANKNDYIEVTPWTNSEGFDVTLFTTIHQQFSMTWGEFAALKKIIKQHNKSN